MLIPTFVFLPCTSSIIKVMDKWQCDWFLALFQYFCHRGEHFGAVLRALLLSWIFSGYVLYPVAVYSHLMGGFFVPLPPPEGSKESENSSRVLLDYVDEPLLYITGTDWKFEQAKLCCTAMEELYREPRNTQILGSFCFENGEGEGADFPKDYQRVCRFSMYSKYLFWYKLMRSLNELGCVNLASPSETCSGNYWGKLGQNEWNSLLSVVRARAKFCFFWTRTLVLVETHATLLILSPLPRNPSF